MSAVSMSEDDFTYSSATCLRYTLQELSEGVQQVRRQMVTFVSNPDTETDKRSMRETLSKLNCLIFQADKQASALDDAAQDVYGETQLMERQRIARLLKQLPDLRREIVLLSEEGRKTLIAASGKIQSTKMPTPQITELGEMREEESLLNADDFTDEDEDFQAIVDEAQIDSIIRMERDEDLTKVSSKVAIVKEAFQDLATIAQNQSHIIDDIEGMITSTRENTALGMKEIASARQYQGHQRKKQFCLYSLGVFLFLILVVIMML